MSLFGKNHTYPIGVDVGEDSVKLAQLGHEVVLCDLSADMLAMAEAQIAEKGLQQKIKLLHCPIQELDQHLGTETFDLVLCHAVVEWLADPEQALKGLYGHINDGGILSLMFYNRHGQLFHNLVVGNFGYVKAGLKRKKKVRLTPSNPQIPDQIYGWLEHGGLEIIGKTGVRVLHDYVRDKQLQTEGLEELLDMEQRHCRLEPFISLGRYIHVMALKPSRS